ncbi:anthranilate phosphoribosyltransferase [Bacillus sp. 03113]|uniref:anthranilate phosphoribosyltransferase n=1 Tax=Bacillus sp. 03113 TaxID=2578211 RepID=UPI0011422051|nr:anthranilate phosphoribosyltransferase [Bacillus sp. 03113]
MRAILQQLSEKKSFTENEMYETVSKFFSEEVTDSEMAAFLMGLKMKGETVEEIVGFVKALKEKSLSFTKGIPNCLDNCGTGGDGSKSFNVSSTSAFVIAGAGIRVAKHGNRSISSKTGSADVLENLGIALNLSPERIEEILEEAGIAFLFAQHVHPRMKRIIKVRRELGIPTVFNLIGPLTNPIELDYQLLGIYRKDYTMMFAEVLKKLGRKRAVVLNGAGSMDEASLQGENELVILQNGEITKKILHPEEVGLSVYDNSAIRGGDAKENADILVRVLKGEKGAYRDTVLLNAGIGIFTGAKANTIEEGIKLAAESIDSGAALEKLEKLVKLSKELQKEGI